MGLGTENIETAFFRLPLDDFTIKGNIMTQPHKLPNPEFLELIKNGPLISIDLIIKNKRGEALVGYRNNSPARNMWFVPGGRIYKNQRLDAEFERITATELGKTYKRSEARFYRIAEHFYPGENVFDAPGVDTHYIVLAYTLDNFEEEFAPADNQHTLFRWMPVEELLQRDDVHENTKDYFRAFPGENRYGEPIKNEWA
jgi:colanic acid biosynthesis protein WcaH